ncbi:alginate O-acetyltransferase AlgX-related protein [Agrobacterium cavarae]|uniref:alginate O-acetyltransferase AlgX-related protein n=1 Tax=Agrobacterium cavarae TaxID=2528239 RepID=UPI003FD4825C
MTVARSTLAFQLLLPAALFGYAGIANFAMPARITPSQSQQELSLSSYFNGGVTGHLEELYRDGLPHRQPAVEMVGAARYLLLGEGRRGVVAGANGYLFTDEEFRFSGNTDALVSESVDQIATVSQTLADRGIKLIMVPLPMKSDIYHNELDQPAASSMAKEIYDSFQAKLAARGVSSVDTRSALVAAQKDQQVFLRTDTHWTPAGAQVVAEAVAAQALGEKPGIFDPVPGKSEEVEGDLVKYVTGGVFASFVGLGTETVTPFILATKTENAPVDDLFGEATSIPVALIGTSYSANELWSFAPLLSSKTGLDVSNAALVGQGPVTPMRKYLASLGEGAAQPESVVWEFPVRFLTDAHLWSETPQKKEVVGHGSH